MTSKYICFDDRDAGPVAVIFPELLVHKDVWRGLGRAGSAPLGAGFVNIAISRDSEVLIQAYGESVSLGWPSRKELDAKYIRKALGLE